jgi:hypothetical protein
MGSFLQVGSLVLIYKFHFSGASQMFVNLGSLLLVKSQVLKISLTLNAWLGFDAYRLRNLMSLALLVGLPTE